MSDDIEDLLARMKPAGVEPDVRSRVLDAVAAELANSPDRVVPCCHAEGHRFICERCGAVAQRPSRARRWATAAVLTAMTSAAAVLLMIVIADRQDRAVERPGRLTAMSSTANGQTASGAIASENQPQHAPAAEIASAPRDSGDPTAEGGVSSRFLSTQRSDDRQVLSAAGFVVPSDRVARINRPVGQGQSSTIDIEASDARITNGALFDRILLEAGVAGRFASPSHRQSTILPGSRS
jgi:negative regulator of sigma E activity